jgi:hypothetical protein
MEAYLRPGEMAMLSSDRIIQPARGANGFRTPWTLLLNPQELSLPSKTGSFDDSIPMDLLEQAFLGPLLEEAKALSQDQDTVLGLSYPQFAQLFQKAVQRCNLGNLKVVAYQLRHSGASKDRISKVRVLSEVKKRGRWSSDASVARYEKGARIGQVLNSLPGLTREKAIRCTERISEVLAGRHVN